MATCKLCGKKGLFLKLNGNGVCAECEKRHKTATTKIERSTKQTDVADTEIQLLLKADEQFKSDGDINKRIAIYESILTKKPKWNSFNYCMKLVNMYLDEGNNNKAWGQLNKMLGWFASFPNPNAYFDKIYMCQFKILKKEKKHKDALRMLIWSQAGYVDGQYSQRMPFNDERMLKDGKTTAKAMGLSEESFVDLISRVSKAVKQKRDSYDELDALYQNFLSEHGLN